MRGARDGVEEATAPTTTSAYLSAVVFGERLLRARQVASRYRAFAMSTAPCMISATPVQRHSGWATLRQGGIAAFNRFALGSPAPAPRHYPF
jgi:hypothetical protein